jgi:hypothetical protein
MRNTSFLLVGLVLSVSSLCAQVSPTQSPQLSASVNEPQLLGTWVAVHRSLGGLGSMCTFLPAGKLEMSLGPIVEGWYAVDGDKLIEPPGSSLPDAKPSVTRFRVEGDTLYKKEGSVEMRYLRVGTAEAGAAPIVGVWHADPQATTASIMEQQRKAGRQIDGRAAQSMVYMVNHQFREYTRDGLIKFRLPMRTTPGTYDAASQTFAVASGDATASSAKRVGRFRLENGLLVLTRPDGKAEDAYIRANATKEEMKRAGVRYGDRAAELEPPLELLKSISN